MKLTLFAYLGGLAIAELLGAIDSRGWPWWMMLIFAIVIPAILGHVAALLTKRRSYE